MSLASKGITKGGAGGGGGGGATSGGTSSGGTGGGDRGAAPVSATGGGGAAGGTEIDPDTILNSRTNVARVLWFDIENRRVIRCEDRLNTSFEMEAGQAAGGAGGAEGGGAADAEPTRVNYNLFVVTQYDDTIPDPQPLYTNGYLTAHHNPDHNPDDAKKPNNRDKTLVQEPSLRGKVVPK